MTAEKPTECVFCAKPGENRDRENGILFRGTANFVILNAFPYNPGHLMVVPYEHCPGLDKLGLDTARQMMELTRIAIRALTEVMSPAGVNVGVNQGRAAGAGIADHVHQHVIPRWVGDTNFMTTVAHTKVLPEMVLETYDKLAPHFADLILESE